MQTSFRALIPSAFCGVRAEMFAFVVISCYVNVISGAHILLPVHPSFDFWTFILKILEMFESLKSETILQQSSFSCYKLYASQNGGDTQ